MPGPGPGLGLVLELGALELVLELVLVLELELVLGATPLAPPAGRWTPACTRRSPRWGLRAWRT